MPSIIRVADVSAVSTAAFASLINKFLRIAFSDCRNVPFDIAKLRGILVIGFINASLSVAALQTNSPKAGDLLSESTLLLGSSSHFLCLF